jgi:hypothetical protein
MSHRMRTAVILFLCAVVWPFSPARAVLLYSTPTRNGTPDSSSIAYPAWQLEGRFQQLGQETFLLTPIASQYFVTAAHVVHDNPDVLGNAVVFQGQSYAIDTSYASGGARFDTGSDLAVGKIQGTFPTFAPLYTSGDEKDKQMVVIGQGTARGGAVNVAGNLQGWGWGAVDHMQSWGQNTVSGIASLEGNKGPGLAFAFNASDPTACTLSSGDSGGGVFIQSGGQWRLAGINYSVDGYYSNVGSASDQFLAAMFDKRGLYEGQGTSWTLISGPDPVPASAYATRISSNLDFINTSIPEPGVVWLAPALLWILRRRR